METITEQQPRFTGPEIAEIEKKFQDAVGAEMEAWLASIEQNMAVLYEEFNRLWFGGKLPVVPVYLGLKPWKDGDRLYGGYDPEDVEIKILIPGHRAKDSMENDVVEQKNLDEEIKRVLIHEMVHVWRPDAENFDKYGWPNDGNSWHGPVFRGGLYRLALRGCKLAAQDLLAMTEEGLWTDSRGVCVQKLYAVLRNAYDWVWPQYLHPDDSPF